MTMRSDITIRQLRNTYRFRAWICEGRNEEDPGIADTLVVVFSGIGAKESDCPGYEFPRLATQDGQRHVLFIADPLRTWLNEPGLIEDIVALIEETKARLGLTRVVMMGHSMGGFMASVLPSFTPVEACLCFSPQGTVHPDLIPGDMRWWEHREKITEYRIRDATDYLSPATHYYVIFGRAQKEANQIERFVPAENLHLFLLPDTSHDSAAKIKASGQLARLIRFAIQHRPRMVRELMQQRLGALHLTSAEERDAALMDEADQASQVAS
ncbi:hypothetical protein [Primorskyibacter sp. S187A]|uniref:alpha/beta hydrolase n=1 Tax=Primorskyibacter sp. S187A TaxID=3415130 RepID=UPI003C7E1A43